MPETATTQLPSHYAMAWPTLVALKEAGALRNNEIVDAVADLLHLTDGQRALKRRPTGGRTVLDYRLAWSRTLLKNMGAIINDSPAHWKVTDFGLSVTEQDIKKVKQRWVDDLRERNEADRRRRQSVVA